MKIVTGFIFSLASILFGVGIYFLFRSFFISAHPYAQKSLWALVVFTISLVVLTWIIYGLKYKPEDVETSFKTLSYILVPIILAVGGYFFQASIQSRNLSKDYFELALNIVLDPTKPTELRKWAVDLLATHAPSPMPKQLRDRIISGQITLSGSISGETIFPSYVNGISSSFGIAVGSRWKTFCIFDVQKNTILRSWENKGDILRYLPDWENSWIDVVPDGSRVYFLSDALYQVDLESGIESQVIWGYSNFFPSENRVAHETAIVASQYGHYIYIGFSNGSIGRLMIPDNVFRDSPIIGGSKPVRYIQETESGVCFADSEGNVFSVDSNFKFARRMGSIPNSDLYLGTNSCFSMDGKSVLYLNAETSNSSTLNEFSFYNKLNNIRARFDKDQFLRLTPNPDGSGLVCFNYEGFIQVLDANLAQKDHFYLGDGVYYAVAREGELLTHDGSNSFKRIQLQDNEINEHK